MKADYVLLFSAIGILLVLGVGYSLYMGQADVIVASLAILVIATFLLLACLISACYDNSRDPIYLLFFLVLIIWPLINAGISYHLMLSSGPGKFGFEKRIGGFGDCVSAMILSTRPVFAKVYLARISLFAMLITNTLLLVPFLMMYRRARKRMQSIRKEGETTRTSGSHVHSHP